MHRLQTRADTLWVGPRYDFQVPVSRPNLTVGGYSVTNVAASYELSDRVTGFVRIDNLLNRRYHEFVGFPSPGIYARMGFQYRFR